MKKIAFFLGIVLLGLVQSEDEKKWVWEKNSRSNKLQDEPTGLRASPRYEIFEPEGADYDYDRPIRPQRPSGPLGPLGPYPNRPGIDYGQGRPPQRPYYPQQNNEDFPGRPPFKKFDTCSCTERFNCQSPGLSYGHCDVGKSYCCFNKHGGLDLGPAPSRPIQSAANGILVGPSNGGDIGYGARPDFDRPGPGPAHLGGEYPRPGGHYDRPGYDRPNYGRPSGYGSRPGYGGRPQGILVGPGGPTGLIGRPGGRPLHGGDNGVLVGPGGPYDRPYGGGPYNRPLGIYGRSAGRSADSLSDANKDDKKDRKD